MFKISKCVVWLKILYHMLAVSKNDVAGLSK